MVVSGRNFHSLGIDERFLIILTALDGRFFMHRNERVFAVRGNTPRGGILGAEQSDGRIKAAKK